MLARFIRFGAALAFPLTIVGAAAAQYDTTEPPAGLMLFTGEDFRGEVQEVFEPVYTLNDYYFNDRARSVAVLSGAWELCEHSDFTGRCVFVRGDVQDLGWYGLDGELTSVRPIQEYTEAEHGLMFTRDQSGYIRYADNARYGSDSYSHGYGASTRASISVYHYGYSPSYRSHGYYNPRLGHGPYGFGWTRAGANPYYGRRDYRRERPPLKGHYGARKGAVTLYTDSYERGASLGLNRGISDLSRYRFNDNISSLKIRSGKWEVCEHANYKGRCQIVDATTDRLNGIRLNDNISSIRPVGDSPREGRAGGNRDGGQASRDRPGDGRDGNHGGRRGNHVETATRTAPDTLAGGPSARTTGTLRRPQAQPGRPQRANVGAPDRSRPSIRSIQPDRTAARQPNVRQVQPAATNPSRVQTERRPMTTPRKPQKAAVDARPKALNRAQPQRRAVPARPQSQARPQVQPRQQVRSQPQQMARPKPQAAAKPKVRPQARQQARPQQKARPQVQRQPARAAPQPRSQPKPAARPAPRPKAQRPQTRSPKARNNQGGKVHKD